MIEHNGKSYARVSEILAPFCNFGDIDPEVLAKKAAIGTATHEAIAEVIKGEFPTIQGRPQRYLTSFIRWNNHMKPTYLLNEERFFNDELMLTGAIDALATFPGEELPILLDWKTSASESPVTWPMQAHLYYKLCSLNGHHIQPRFLFVRLSDKMEMPIVHVYHYQENTMNRCLQAVRDFHEKKHMS
jgi:hypothetical protein